jgi:predicted dehydrogenase
MAKKTVGYALVGLGHIAQAAVLPAFARAKRARLVALVSSDEEKLQALGDRYEVQHRFSYDDFEQCLALDEVQAVYIALPNDKHLEFTERAARAGKHVLCEKPMEVSSERSTRMIEACEAAGVKLMIAYRLHFEPANLDAVKRAQAGELGDLRFFSSEFSFQVQEDNIRTQHERGGGVLWDIGVYCVNGARYLFRDEPEEVFAFATSGHDRRFAEIEETVGCVIRFPQGRLATFTVSFGAAPTSSFRLVGTQGDLRLDNAYNWVSGKKMELTVDEETRSKRFKAVDQFAGELDAFARCVLEDRDPEANGREGLIDVKVIEAIYESIQTGRPVRLDDLPHRSRRPDEDMAYRLPPQKEEPELVGVQPPSQ